MGNVIANISKGRFKEYALLGGGANDAFIILLLTTTGIEADGTLVDYDDIAAMLAASNTEADFTNYARKTITSVTVTVDDSADRLDVDIADQVWTSAGGATNNTLDTLVVAYDPDTTAGTDSTLVPISYHDFSATTDGTDLTAQIASAGLLRAS